MLETEIGRHLLVSTVEAARIAGVEPHTVRAWVHRGRLRVASRQSNGRPLYDPREVVLVERATRTGEVRHLAEVAGSDQVGWVYYAAFGEFIKIGYTRHLRQRLLGIPADHLLATEPGTQALEQDRLRAFESSSLGGEWFDATDTCLCEHIDELRADYGTPWVGLRDS